MPVAAYILIQAEVGRSQDEGWVGSGQLEVALKLVATSEHHGVAEAAGLRA